MAGQPVTFGIDGFGFAFGTDQDVADTAASYVSDPERVLRWGYRTFHRAEDGVTATILAAQAAQDLLATTRTDPEQLDLVALATSEMPEYPHWDTSASLARELKIRETQTLLLTEGCASGVTGLGMVAGQFAIQPELQTVLFVAVNRVSEFHRNRMNVNNAVHSDGAVAVLLRRGHTGCQWLSTAQFTDPELCDWFRTDHGGAVSPVPPPGWSSATAPSGTETVQAHFRKDPQRLQAFGELLTRRMVDVVEQACRQAGIDRDEVAHLVHINDPDGIADIAAAYPLPASRTNAAVAAEHGHMGAADQLVCLGEHLRRGDVRPGEVVALAGISIGMRWYCTLVRV